MWRNNDLQPPVVTYFKILMVIFLQNLQVTSYVGLGCHKEKIMNEQTDLGKRKTMY